MVNEKNISRYAHLYDKYADIQCLAAAGLIKESPDKRAHNILEIGCGTGNYTLLLRGRYNNARIKALDLSGSMLEVAKKKLKGKEIEFLLIDGRKYEPDEKFDLITSNAALQWFDSMESTIVRYGNCLTPEGVLSFSVFGPLTFRELGRSLKEALGADAIISAERFSDKDDIERTLQRYFKEISIREHIAKETFSSLSELLNKIRCTGARGSASDNLFLWKRSMMSRVEDIYRSNFGKIEATYQIFFCMGKTVMNPAHS